MRLTIPGVATGMPHANHRRAPAIETIAAADGSARLIYLDPPFGTGKDFFLDRTGDDGQEVLAYADEHVGPDDHVRFATELAHACRQHLATNGHVVIQTDANCTAHYRYAFAHVFGEAGYQGEVIVRAGSRDATPRPQASSSLTPTHNTLLIFGTQPVPRTGVPTYQPSDCQGATPSSQGAAVDTLWCDLETRGRDSGYPTEKSRALAARLISWLSEPDDLLVEPFAGSASFSVEALAMGRRVAAGDVGDVALSLGGCRLAHQLLRLGVQGSVEVAEPSADLPLPFGNGTMFWVTGSAPELQVIAECSSATSEPHAGRPTGMFAIGHDGSTSLRKIR